MIPNGIQLTQIAELIQEGKLKPVIDQIFPFEKAKECLNL